MRALAALPGRDEEPWVAACTSRGQITIWHALTGATVSVRPIPGATALASLSAPDRRTYLAAGCADGSVHIWDPTVDGRQLTIPLNITVTTLTALGANLAVGTVQGLVVVSPEWDVLASRCSSKQAVGDASAGNAPTRTGRWKGGRPLRGLLRETFLWR